MILVLLFLSGCVGTEVNDPFAGNLVKVPGGTFVMGNSLDAQLKVGELKAQNVKVDDFMIDSAAATNEEYRAFVRESKYKTDSEKFGWSFVLRYHATDKAKELSESEVKEAQHWLAVPQAYWRAPDGPGSGISTVLDHPATHISFEDALAYCKWRGLRLPTEAEWERAARGGVSEQRYPWGNEKPFEGDEWRLNVWQGKFPDENSEKDGFGTTCPSRHFEANGYGLYNVLGNVWEWTSTKYVDPLRPPKPKDPEQRVLRGGSFLDSVDGSFNHFVDMNTRMPNTRDSASSNTGVRCAKSVKKKKSPGTGYRYPKPAVKKAKPQMDQAELQRIFEEGGVEALQAHLGSGATVTTPGKLKEKQAELKRQLKEMEEQARGGSDENPDEHIEL
uniref:Sulfatase-modifying factor enzyme-like domain-containing protein n=1 Tax=Mucochytrium quahogii TaxID=96639 RepID=A0A7S2RXI5_9STRA|mmetsp:Transcript_5302/g.8167  ORF Transcript_5302/g.8167 Transcript_5302/m.8167 type:complete len:389 (-) Transcript_5302:43-1209(-)